MIFQELQLICLRPKEYTVINASSSCFNEGALEVEVLLPKRVVSAMEKRDKNEKEGKHLCTPGTAMSLNLVKLHDSLPDFQKEHTRGKITGSSGDWLNLIMISHFLGLL
jgi:hypothetical protein